MSLKYMGICVQHLIIKVWMDDVFYNKNINIIKD